MGKFKRILPFIILLVFAILCLSSMKQKGFTSDEVSHISSGYSYVKEWDYRLNPEHPPLVKMLSGIALLSLDPKLPTNQTLWSEALTESKAQWGYGKDFFFKANDNASQLLYWARVPIVLLGCLLGYLIFLWSKSLYGYRAGIFSLSLFAFSPNMIAHSRLVTTDIGITLFMVMFFFFYKRTLDNPKRSNIILSGVALGLAFATKFTSLYMLPIIAAYVLVALNEKHKKIRDYFKWENFEKQIILLVYISLIGFIVLAATYLFFNFGSYIEGLKLVFSHSLKGHPAYLMGELSMNGWWYYFPIAFILKTPIPIIFFFSAALLFMIRHWHKDIRQEFYLLIPILVYLIVNLFQHINIGLRHILPIYPFIFIFCGRLLKIGVRRIYRMIFIVLCIWLVFGTLFIFPNYLSYFNEFVGPEDGPKYLIDSNVDWGQDLPALKRYLDSEGIDEIVIGYFGNDDYRYYGINSPNNMILCEPFGGKYYAVSVNFYYGLIPGMRDCMKWLDDYDPRARIGNSIYLFELTDDYKK